MKDTNNMGKCPNCGNIIDISKEKCCWCHANLNEEVVWSDGWTGITNTGRRVILPGNSASSISAIDTQHDGL